MEGSWEEGQGARVGAGKEETEFLRVNKSVESSGSSLLSEVWKFPLSVQLNS